MSFLPLPIGGAGSLGAAAMGSTAAGVGQFGGAQSLASLLPFLSGLGGGMGQGSQSAAPQPQAPAPQMGSFFKGPVRLPAPLPVRHAGIPR